MASASSLCVISNWHLFIFALDQPDQLHQDESSENVGYGRIISPPPLRFVGHRWNTHDDEDDDDVEVSLVLYPNISFQTSSLRSHPRLVNKSLIHCGAPLEKQALFFFINNRWTSGLILSLSRSDAPSMLLLFVASHVAIRSCKFIVTDTFCGGKESSLGPGDANFGETWKTSQCQINILKLPSGLLICRREELLELNN